MKISVLERVSVGMDIDLTCFEKYGEVTYYNLTPAEEVSAQIGDADIVIANKARLNADTLGSCPNVKLICEFATGFDNVDIKYCRERGIDVCNVSGYSTHSVAQHTFAMYFYLSENLRWYDDFVKGGAYMNQPRFSNFDRSFLELNGQTWGIIGMGNIGQEVAKIAESFGCRVIFYSVTGKNKVTGYEQVGFDELLARADVLSIHCPLSDLTRNLIDGDALKKMKKNAVLINVARGPVVDNTALAEALNAGTIAAAGLDVLEKEPIQKENPLSEIQDSGKLLITPHMAWAGTGARTKLIDEICLNIEAFLKGEKRNVVNNV